MTYERLLTNPFPALVDELNYKLHLVLEVALITKKEFYYLRVPEYNTPTFFIIPKVHRSLQKPPGRPIILVIRGPLKRVGKYLDARLKEMALPSYVQDTRDVL